MKREKDKILEKLIQKDYNNKLEEVLSKKSFDENTKNLLLDMFYKIEASYKDYTKVKQNVLTKEEYIQKLIDVIDECNNIKLVKPNSDEEELLDNRTFIVDKEKMEIITYPIERKLLYTLSKINKKDDIIRSKNELLNKCMTNLLNVGNNINTVEPLRDFNGFSWNIVSKDIENKFYNLVYQDLLILVDNVMFERWVNDNNIDLNYLEIFSDVLSELYGARITNKIIFVLFELSILLEISVNKDIITEFEEKKNELNSQHDKFENKEEYINLITQENKNMNRRIKKIDSIVNNKALLKDEYERQNEVLPLEKKIFSTRVLTHMLKEEREELLNKISENNDLMKPEKYMEKRKSIDNELKYYKLLETENVEKEIMKKIILLQKYILTIIEIKIDKAKDKEELIEILYELRYYNLIPIQEGKRVIELDSLVIDIENVEKKAINKAINLKVMNQISKEESLNFYILQNIFNLKIIKLEDISLKLLKEKENYFIQFFDGETIDEKRKIEKRINKKDLKTRINKKMRVFNKK